MPFPPVSQVQPYSYAYGISIKQFRAIAGLHLLEVKTILKVLEESLKS
ncbi:ATP-dependent DNA helicase pif1, partial [Fusarium oxysporum f. sp. albedinis]